MFRSYLVTALVGAFLLLAAAARAEDKPPDYPKPEQTAPDEPLAAKLSGSRRNNVVRARSVSDGWRPPSLTLRALTSHCH